MEENQLSVLISELGEKALPVPTKLSLTFRALAAPRTWKTCHHHLSVYLLLFLFFSGLNL